MSSDDTDPLSGWLPRTALTREEENAVARVQAFISRHAFVKRSRNLNVALELLLAGVLAAGVVMVVIAVGRYGGHPVTSAGKPMTTFPVVTPPGNPKGLPSTAPRTPAVTTACAVNDFKLGTGASGVWQGSATYSMVLVNVSGDACALTGVPPMTVILKSGVREQVTLSELPPSYAVDVGHNQTLVVMIGSPAACTNLGTPKPASSLTVNLPGGNLTDNAVTLDTQCGTPSLLSLTPVDS